MAQQPAGKQRYASAQKLKRCIRSSFIRVQLPKTAYLSYQTANRDAGDRSVNTARVLGSRRRD